MLKIPKGIHRFLPLLMTLALLAGLLPTLTISAAAADFSCDISYGDITIDASSGTVSYSDSSGPQLTTIDSSTEVTVTQTVYASTATPNRITVNGSGTVDLTLKGVNISPSSGSPFSIAPGAAVNLTLMETNTLTCNADTYPGLSVPSDATLTITSASTGSLTVTGHDCGAGIGSGINVAAGTVNIYGGTVTAYAGGEGAGIGGGRKGSGGTVNISGGTVTATGSNYGAGIGGGSYSGGTVNISGGTVTAASLSRSAGIGGGYQATSAVTVYISGGSVKASSLYGDDIGKGAEASSSVTLQNNNIDQTPVYLTTVTLANASGANIGEATVSSLTASLSSTSYSAKDMKTDSNGKLYLYLPVGTVTTRAVSSGEQYTGTITTNAAGTAAGTLTNTATISAAAADCTYDGASHAGYTASVLNASGNTVSTTLYTLSAEYYSGTDTTAAPLGGAPTNVGSYTVKLSLSSTNYKASSVSVPFTISKQTATINAAAANCAYDGSSHAGYTLTGATDTSNTTIDSSLYTLTPKYYSGTDTAAAPLGGAPTDAGSYTVVLSLSSTNYTASQAVYFTIDKCQPAVDLSANRSPATDGIEVTLSVTVSKASNGAYPSGNVIFKADGTPIGTGSLTNGQAQCLWITTSTGTYELTVEYGGDSNYAAASDTISHYDVSKYNQDDLTISGVPATLTYGDSAFTLTVSGGSGSGAVNWSSSDTSVASVDSIGAVTINGAGSCDITATKAADNAYNEASAQTEITVSKQSATISAIAVSGTYNGSSQAGYQGISVSSVYNNELSVNLYTISATYYSGTGTDGTALGGAPTDVGTYTAALSLLSTNYTATTQSVTFTIDKYQPTISTQPTALSISSGSALSASTLTGGTVTGVNGETVSGSFVWTDGTITVSAAGSYGVTFTPDSANYTTASADVAVSLKSSGGSSSGGSSSGGSKGSTTTYNYTTSTSNSLTTTTATVTAALGADGTASASVTGKQLTDAIGNAEKQAAENGTQSRINISVTAPGGATGVSLTIPHSAFNTLADSSIGSLRLTTPSGSVTFDSKAIDTINDKASGDITITIKEADTSGLSDEDKGKIGDRPIYDFTVTSGGTTISDFGGGTASVSIPYTLKNGEDPNNIVIYYRSASGALVMVPNCVYDASTGTIKFTTNHFSTYAVGYSEVSFTDVASSAWYTDYISFLAARKIISGTGNGTFSPDANITRAQFITILANLSGDDLSRYTASSFSDVVTTDWYFPAAQWAYENGVASGSGGKFNPNDTITRQDIAVMIMHYAEKVAGYTLPETTDAITFTDASDIAAYATEAVTAMQQAGIISGNGNGSFAPNANATRAQAAKTLSLLLQGMLRG